MRQFWYALLGGLLLLAFWLAFGALMYRMLG